MSGFALRAVGLTLFVPSAILLVLIALFRARIQKAIYQRYLNQYGSKLFFSVHPELRGDAAFQGNVKAKPDIALQENAEAKPDAAFQESVEPKPDAASESPPALEQSDAPFTLEEWNQLVRKAEENIRRVEEGRSRAEESLSLENACLDRLRQEAEERDRQNRKKFLEDTSVFSVDEFPYELPDRQNPLIRSGDNGDAYLAAHKRTGKTVVVKVSKSLNTPKERLQSVVSLLRDLRHPMIPTLYDFYSSDKRDKSYVIMEYVDGQTLEKRLGDDALVEQPQCLNWTYGLLDALGYLHKKGMAYGDIQPSNILLSHDGSLHLIDFSKAIANLNGEANPRQDLYQLGAMMFRLLTGKAFQESDAPQARETLLRKRGVSEPVIRVILKATDADAESRYQSAEEMLSELRDMVRNGPEIRRYHLLMGGLAPAALFALAIAGAVCLYHGQRIRIQEADVLDWTRQASDAFDEGDYSQALERALDAASVADRAASVSGKARAEAERVLAKVSGAYDLSPGYKPEYSIGSEALLGRPLKAAVSPDGKRLVALASEKSDADDDNFSTTLYLQFFDAQNGRELAKPVKAYPSALSEFEFLDDRILLYAGERGLTVCALPEAAPDSGDAPAVRTLDAGRPATGIAISADGKTVACVERNQDEAILYRIVRDGDSVRLENQTHLPFPVGKAQSAPSRDTFTDPMDNLFALDETGARLALSFSDGTLYIADVSDFSRLKDTEKIYKEIPLPSNRYQHFEGGFHGDFFLYSASTKSLSGAVKSFSETLRTDDMTAVEGLSIGEVPFRCHAWADKGAAYISVENLLRRADFPAETWEIADYADGPITILRHDAGRALVVTANCAVSAYDADKGKSDVSDGTPYNIAAFAGDTLLLASQDRPTLSVLRWTNPEPILRYDPAFEHMYASIRADFSSALLYRAHDCQAFDADGYSIGYHAFDDHGQILKQDYLRASETSVGQDALATVYADRIDYYDATANFLFSEEVETNPDAIDQFLTEDYFIEARSNDFIRIRRRATGEIILELDKENLKDAVQQGNQLLLSMLTMDGTQYSLLLDPNGEILAELPNLCDVLPNQTLAFDYGRGELFAGRLYSMKDLISFASDGRNQRT